MKQNRLNTDHVQPKKSLFTSDSQHPPRSIHAVNLGGDTRAWVAIQFDNGLFT